MNNANFVAFAESPAATASRHSNRSKDRNPLSNGNLRSERPVRSRRRSYPARSGASVRQHFLPLSNHHSAHCPVAKT